MHICRRLRFPQTPPPARLVAWTASQNYVLLFSQHLSACISKKPRQPALYSRRQPANSLSSHIFSYQPHNLQPARNLHSGLTGQHVSLSFFSAPRPKNRGQPAKPIPLYFNYNSNPSISFAISFTALLAVQSVYSSTQATQWSYINATRSPVSLILALISAIFFSSSLFNPF